MKTKLLSIALTTLQLNLFASGPATEGFVAHEWGTFTSVQGADGVQLEWNPLVTSELPKFVYDPSKPSGEPRRHISTYGGKSVFRTLQRMETPVIYFYSAKERSVDVTVKFPQGLITEWFPQAHDVGPSWVEPRPALAKLDSLTDKVGVHPGFNFATLDTRKGIAESMIRWEGVKILPAKDNPQLASRLPTDSSGSHYYAARGTDADFLRVDGAVNETNRVEHEKFLFYRGIGNFKAPLEVTLGSDDGFIQLHNIGVERLAHLFILSVRHGRGNLTPLGQLGAGETAPVKLETVRVPLSNLTETVSAAMKAALVTEGLYPREASAMVQTWQDSWFSEEGLRVLYIIPRKWADQVLPLALSPAPRELVRVMVGRAEMITPAMEWQLLKQIVKFSESDEAGRLQAAAEARAIGLGRFAEPAMRRILGKTPSPEFNQQAWKLLEAMKPLPKAGKALAAN